MARGARPNLVILHNQLARATGLTASVKRLGTTMPPQTRPWRATNSQSAGRAQASSTQCSRVQTVRFRTSRGLAREFRSEQVPGIRKPTTTRKAAELLKTSTTMKPSAPTKLSVYIRVARARTTKVLTSGDPASSSRSARAPNTRLRTSRFPIKEDPARNSKSETVPRVRK